VTTSKLRPRKQQSWPEKLAALDKQQEILQTQLGGLEGKKHKAFQNFKRLLAKDEVVFVGVFLLCWRLTYTTPTTRVQAEKKRLAAEARQREEANRVAKMAAAAAAPPQGPIFLLSAPPQPPPPPPPQQQQQQQLLPQQQPPQQQQLLPQRLIGAPVFHPQLMRPGGINAGVGFAPASATPPGLFRDVGIPVRAPASATSPATYGSAVVTGNDDQRKRRRSPSPPAFDARKQGRFDRLPPFMAQAASPQLSRVPPPPPPPVSRVMWVHVDVLVCCLVVWFKKNSPVFSRSLLTRSEFCSHNSNGV
jgi:hypothetical protein